MSLFGLRTMVIVGLVVLPTPATAQTLDDFVEWLPDLVLEETVDTYVGSVSLRSDPQGGWITWDPVSHQVRLYEASGALRAYFGSEGSGPGEFRRLVSADRLEDQRLVALDSRGRLSVWDSAGSTVQLDFDSGVRRPFGLIAGRGDTVVVSGLVLAGPQALGDALLHKVALAEQAIVGAALTVPAMQDHARLVATIQSVGPAKVRDGLVASIAVLDSLWVAPSNVGQPVQRLQIPGGLIAGLREERPPLDEVPDVQAWIAEHAFVGNTFQRSDGGWLIQLWSFDTEPWSGLVALDPTGGLEWEVAGVPQLAWFESESETLYFWDPNGLNPAVVRVAKLR